MAAPRATQLIALRHLARGNAHQARHLHMTGPTTYASRVLAPERPALNLPRDLPGLRAECKSRQLDHSGSKQDLIARLDADGIVRSRAFSTAVDRSKRPTAADAAAAADPPTATRHFNTSRALQAVGDTSTIDFAYMPDLGAEAEAEAAAAAEGQVRMPLIPGHSAVRAARAPEAEAEPAVMRAQISTMSADAVFLPMSDLHDGHAMNVDFHAMADRVAFNLKRMRVPAEEQASMMKQIWNDMVDDMLGVSKKPAAN